MSDEPPEKRGRARLKRAPESSNHQSFTSRLEVNSTTRGYGLEDGRVVETVDGVMQTQLWDAEVAESLLTPEELTTKAIRVAALRRYMNLEPRSCAEIAAELGVGRAAVSKIYRDVVQRVGGWRLLERAAWRSRISSATSARWAARKSKETDA